MILFGYEPLFWYWSMPDYMWQHISFRSLGMVGGVISVERYDLSLVPFRSEANPDRTSRPVADYLGEKTAQLREYQPDAFFAGLSRASQ